MVARDGEEKKIRQARADELVFLNYQINIKSQRLEEIKAHLRKRLASADLRLMLQMYPRK